MKAHDGVERLRHPPTPRPLERCPTCGRQLTTGKFDMTFRLADRSERLCFGIPAGLCEHCDQLCINPPLVARLDLDAARLVFAIETDCVAQERSPTRAGQSPTR